MQAYPNYYPQMNNYSSQFNPQQAYMERLANAQQYQQNLQMAQPQMTVAPQQQFQQMPVGINGKVVLSVENITANDVPMDGSVAFFPRQDMAEIYAKSWNSDGTIHTTVFKPVLEGIPSNPAQIDEKLKIGLSEDVTAAFMQRFDDIADRIEKLEKSMANPITKSSGSRTKKEIVSDE